MAAEPLCRKHKDAFMIAVLMQRVGLTWGEVQETQRLAAAPAPNGDGAKP
jgi:hypothetical protein